jgi:hypothetical protein
VFSRTLQRLMPSPFELRLGWSVFLIALFVATLTSSASARDCSEDELLDLQKMPASCPEAQQRISAFRKCSNVPAARREIIEIRLETNRTLVCDGCQGANDKLKRVLAEQPSDCLERFLRLAAVTTLSQCPLTTGVAAKTLTAMQEEVKKCSCEAFEQRAQNTNPTSCKEARHLKHQTQLWRQCSSADQKTIETVAAQAAAAERRLCPPPDEPIPLSSLFRTAREKLIEVNDQIATNKTCRDPSACAELRRAQLERLALYLDFVATTSVPTDADRAEARQILAHVGVAPSALVYIAKCKESKPPCSDEDIDDAIAYFNVLGNPTLRKAVLDRLAGPDTDKVRAALEAVFEAFDEGQDGARIAKAIDDLPPGGQEALRRVFREGRAAPETDPEAWRRRHENELRRVEVVIGASDGSEACAPFVDATLASIVGKRPIHAPTHTRSGAFDTTLMKRVATRSAACTVGTATDGNALEKPGVLGCGSVLGIDAQAAGGRIKVRVELVFILPGATRTESIDVPEFGDSAEERERQVAKLIKEIQMRFDNREHGPLQPVGDPRERCGMKFEQITAPRLPAPRAPGVRLQRDWAAAATKQAPFEAGFDAPYAWKAQWTGPRRETAPVTLRILTKQYEATYRVEVALRDTAQRADLYAFAVIVDEAEPCPEDPLVASWQARWQAAGASAAERVVDYFKTVEVNKQNAAVSRLLLPGAAWWDSDKPAKAIGGYVWSAGDVGLLGSGVLLIGLSINERNRAAEGTGSLKVSQNLQYVGFGLLAGFLVERVVWAFVGTEGNEP